MEINQFTLSGVIVEIGEIRRSAAGIEHLRCVMEHRSRQVEATHPREVSCRIVVEVRGALIRHARSLLRLGERVVVGGFIDKAGFKDDGARFVLHAQLIKTPDSELG